MPVHDTLHEAVDCTGDFLSDLLRSLPLQTFTFSSTFATLTSQHKQFCLLFILLLALVTAVAFTFPNLHSHSHSLFHDCWKSQLTEMPPSKAPTPRTSRNSRGLRNSPFVERTPVVRRSSRRSTKGTTPASTKAVDSFTELPEPATPTPVVRSVNIQTPCPRPGLAASPNRTEPTEQVPTSQATTSLGPVALEPIREEQPPRTPAAASPISAAPEQASITPVSSYTPTGPSTHTPPAQRKVSPLQYRRIALIKGTPVKPVKKAGPVTPIYRPTRFLTRLVDRTPAPKPPPTPRSEGHETRRFAERREQEDDETEFAKGIYLAIRNDHRMRECWCPIPNIYNSKEEAEAGSGHLRFYISDTNGTKSLRVLQKKDDFNWHCHCAQEYHPVCFELLNKNGKRPAQGSELDLIAQNSGLKNSENVKKVVSTPSEPTGEGEKTEQESRWSMWLQARGLFGSVTTMINPITNLIGKLVGAVRGNHYETVDVRRTNEQDGTIVVKRFKRHLGGAEEDEVDGLDWVKNPTEYIGAERLERLAGDFVGQATLVQEGKIVTGLTIKDIMQEQLAGQGVIGISVAIFKYQEMLFGPVTAEWTEVERAERFTEAVKRYIRNLLSTIEMMRNIYSPDNFEILKQEFPKPRSGLGLGNNEFRLAARKAGEFLLFFQSLVDLIPMDLDMVKTVGQVIVDFDAVGKKELVPSLVAVAAAPVGTMPGFFPDEKPSVMEEVPIKELDIQPLYEYRYPSPDPSESDSTPGEPGDYRLIAKPRGILKASKTWSVPSTPKYVPTPQKSRKLVFESPISRFIAPSHIPSRVMTAREAELIVEAERKAELLGDEHSLKVLEATMTTNSRHNASQDQFRWSARGPELEKDDKEMGLSRYYQKYGKFLDDAREDLEQRSERRKRKLEQEERSIYRMTPLKREIRIPRPPQFTTAERRRRAAEAAASMPSPEPDSPISFSPWYKRFTGRGYREEPIEDDDEGGYVMAKPARTKPAQTSRFQGVESDDEGNVVTSESSPGKVQPATPAHVLDLLSSPTTTKVKVKPRFNHQDDKLVVDLTSLPTGSAQRVVNPNVQAQVITERVTRTSSREATKILFGSDPDSDPEDAALIASRAEEERAELARKKKEEEEQLRQRYLNQEKEAAARKAREEEAKRKAAEVEKDKKAKEAQKVAERIKRVEGMKLRAPLRPLHGPVSELWEAAVSELGNQPADQVMAKFPNGRVEGQLTRFDLYERLTRQGPDGEDVWLNDQVIMAALRHMVLTVDKKMGGTKERPRVACLDSYFWKMLVVDKKGVDPMMRAAKRQAGLTPENFYECAFVLVPICENSHWTLGVIRPDLKVVYHLDSLGPGGGEKAKKLLGIAALISGGKWKRDEWEDVSEFIRSPRQRNGNDCGVCTITNAECVLNGIVPAEAWLAREMGQLKRRWIAAMLMNGGYEGEFSLEGI
ncbi:hypothetical protein QC762_605440 [Podospora pseudocomata]|uniref:Ubiquitin-like protease family profile domain-containing protein n=1 Tax=Podospora pseudocomata TaxID=2093779 RepID=A0ABR0G6K1_9PEZI|nr:hypothetical protein QC762_605440 [Podospora pseudocomata]